MVAKKPPDIVKSYGGLIQFQGGVVLVHRPEYNDWTLPKGKPKNGEKPKETAAREIFEETGFTCVLGMKLPVVNCVDHAGRDKQVTYWHAIPTAWENPGESEVDRIMVLPLKRALISLSYSHDKDLLKWWRKYGI